MPNSLPAHTQSNPIYQTIARHYALVEFDIDGNILHVNEKFVDLFGYTPDELIGMAHRRFCPAEYAQSHEYQAFWEALRSGESQQGEIRRVRKDGRDLWLHATYGSVRDENGRVERIFKFASDITQAKLKSLEDAGAVDAIWRALVVVEFDMDARIVDANQAFLDLTGYQREQLIGQPHSILCQADEITGSDYRSHWAALRRGEFRRGEFLRRRKDGRELAIYATYNPILDSLGRPRRILKFVNDLSQRQAMETSLREAKARAEQAVIVKSAFVANMSHELRTPMNAIIGFAEVLLETTLSATQRQHLGTITRSARSLLGLLNDILDMSKLENGACQLESADFSLPQLCTETLETVSHLARNKGLELKLDYAAGLGTYFRGDPMRLQQILLNLLSNAVKFTEQGSVRLKLTEENGQVRIEVIDTGIGIPADRIESIFEPFAQADVSISRRFGGTGLGTTIARQLTQLMGGEIGLHSQPAQGSCFWVRLPLKAGEAPREAPVRPVIALPPLNILVADDVEQNLELLRIRLGKLGHTVHTAANGQQACQFVQENRFDLILMDVQMPILDGLSATRKIRQWEREHNRPPLPIIALTASVQIEDRAATEEAGMNGFALKPIVFNHLLEEIARVLAIEHIAETPESSIDKNAGSAINWAFGIDLWGDRETLVEQIRQFARNTLAQIPELLREQDGRTLHATAHRIKGTAGNLALEQIYALGADLESLTPESPAAAQLWQEMIAQLESLETALS